ncbi:hypothetical protein BJY52DRAFT_1222387 [Lactarius psammicola]|nr:hypothetical protein BJY52DRAFT_1222387 [Lactarius psammicola]
MKLTRKNASGSLRVVEEERDRTLRAGTLNDLLDNTDLPRGSQPPVRSNMEPPSGLVAENPKRVTPWLFRRVNAPVSPTSQTMRHPEKAAADVMGSAEPPSYRSAQESFPSKEKSTDTQNIKITAAAKDSRAGTPPPQSPTRTPTELARPSRPNRTAGPSDASNLRQTGPRGSAEEERSRPGFAVRSSTPPAGPAHPPRYRPHDLSLTPILPPYCATGGSSARSKEPWPQDRSRKPSSEFSGGGPRLALPSRHPLLPDSAVSRIRAAYRVSNELGSAVMLQEVRMATPADYTRPDVASIPRGTRRFVSVTEREGFRKVDARLDRHSSEREGRQRALSRPSDYDGRNHDGRIHRTASERVNPMKIRDISRRQALMLEEAIG